MAELQRLVSAWAGIIARQHPGGWDSIHRAGQAGRHLRHPGQVNKRQIQNCAGRQVSRRSVCVCIWGEKGGAGRGKG